MSLLNSGRSFADLPDRFSLKIRSQPTAAQAEQYVSHQHKQSGFGYEKRSALIREGDKTLERLAAAANERLFRQQGALQSDP